MNDFSPLAIAGSTRSATRALQCAFAWAAVFTAMHGYWYLGGRFGVGDGPDPFPGAPSSPASWTVTILVVLMFAAGLSVPIALLKDTERKIFRRLLVGLLWVGSLVLLARGAAGLLDDAVRSFGPSSRGITGLSYQDLFGTPHPSTYTLISSASVDGYFFLGGILYSSAAWFCGKRSCRTGLSE